MNQPHQPGPPQGPGHEPPTGNGPPGSQRYQTRNHLPESTRADLVERLNRSLADTTILLTHAKFAHWNVKGMSFWGLHELFDELAEVLEAHVDMIAERITALGGQAMGTAGMAVEHCRLPRMPADAAAGAQFVDLLAERLAIHDANLFDDIEAADSYGDPDTADLLNEVSREVTQHLWFMEAHLQDQPIQSGQATAAAASGQQSGAGQQPGTGQPPGPPGPGR